MVTPQQKAEELYGRFLKGYLLITNVMTARINSKECVNDFCNSMIDEILTFGKGDADHLLYTIGFWQEVRTENNNRPI